MSPSKKRRFILYVREKFNVSERRAFKVLGQTRSTYRYIPNPLADEEELTARIIELAGLYGRYGYRRITSLLHMEG